MVYVPLMHLSEWREFPSAPCFAGKKNLMRVHVSMLSKSRASPDMLPFSLCNKKKSSNSAHEKTCLSNDTIDAVLRHRELGWVKDLSASHLPFVTRINKIHAFALMFQFSYSVLNNGNASKLFTTTQNINNHNFTSE